MKKNYITPMVVYEGVKSSTSFSGSCAQKAIHEENSCKVDLSDSFGPDSILFTDEMGCTMVPNDGINVCYHVPIAGANIFTS